VDVATDRRSLIRVVTDEVQMLYETGTSVPDEVSKELSEAWSNAFGRDGNPSDAWDHAIKAVEDVLIPEVMPKKIKATLGTVLGELTGQNRTQWKLVLPGNNQDHDVAHLVGMLRLVWPNHDRHGGATKDRPLNRKPALSLRSRRLSCSGTVKDGSNKSGSRRAPRTIGRLWFVHDGCRSPAGGLCQRLCPQVAGDLVVLYELLEDFALDCVPLADEDLVGFRVALLRARAGSARMR
jgi:hypothetical protein